MDLTLEQLIASLKSDDGIDKVAEDKECKDEDKKEDKGEKKMPPWLKDKEGKSEGKDEKSEDKEEKKDDEKSEKKDDEKGQEKSASEAGAALAREIMTKVASINLETPEMNKQAQTAGQALASALLANLQKKASAGDVVVTDGGAAPGTVPNKVQADVVQAQSEGAASIKPMPTGDGVKNSGTINQIFDAIVQDAMSQGAASEDQVHETGVAGKEGAVEDHAVPGQVKAASEDEIEKAAAISELVAQGVDFDDAVELVKQAAVEIEYEMEKAAAMTQLMAEGVDFDQAIELVKQASAGDVTVTDGGPAPGTVANKVHADVAQAVAEGGSYIKPMLTGDGQTNQGTINEIFDAIVQDALSQGAASEDQVHSTGVAQEEGSVEEHAVPSQVKVAAINKMVEAGVNFEDAVQFVKEAGDKLRGMISPAWMESHIKKEHTGDGKLGAGKALTSHVGGTLRANLRSTAEGLGVGAGAGAVGAGVGALVGLASRGRIKPKDAAGVGGAVGAGAGYVGGSIHGTVKSLSNQAKEMHETYKGQEKKAGVVDAVKAVGSKVVGGVASMSKTQQRVAGAGIAAGVAGGVGATMAMRNREKKAAFDALVEAGVDFDQAASLVAAKAQELYGE